MKRHLKDYFIPHEGNDYKPHSLQQAAMVGMLALVVLSFAAANLQSLIWISSDWMVSAILPGVIVDLTNDERADENLTSLRRNSTLDAAAKLKAEHMAANEYFSHYSPDGVSPWHWFSVSNYKFVHAGENLAIHFTDSDEVVEAWMNSPTHRANIVNGDYTEIGVGAAQGEYEGYQTVYVVQLFGTPAAAAPVPEPAPVVVAEATIPAEEIRSEPELEPEPVIETEPIPEEPESEPAPISQQQIAGSEGLVEEIDDTEVSLSTDRDPIVVEASSTPSSTEAVTEIAEVDVSDEVVTLYSGFVSTTTGGVPASIEPESTTGSSVSTDIFGIATKPQLVLQILYTLIGLFVLVALVLSIAIEWRRHQPVQIAYSAGLMAVMALLFYVHMSVTSGALIV